ncbi:MAG TPA: maleylacetoacetate isomerase [Piscinibacter sp.]|uniref:maleylacetoacetate isomerase n=1 Tax=Piscinibacter sp. TaxID=1903157 RepID=UPI001B7231F3|nr:maleylacetoacetate isomerase [Piscinibacter sp.]MBK7532971.1 maleylacetoacetate isomerase [Piscinibacter sp.]MBL0094024.1 maleylacetoacetate isomerase [Piscinibacter sp.]MBP6542030.1 maleylacetoacetate isomerase [Piscinibacter sp.]HOY34652.1 maleylacetoacetate isomerase [Piscinibacter sp.]HPG79136.1 maleylacetoacetate isomerase [Piscinibacter sp.]
MQLFNYFRSSASYRVRIALALKGLDYDYMPVQLARNEHFKESYAALSPARLVPLLKDDERIVTQSLAIIEYLDELHPQPPLLPGTALERARIRALALDVACEIHPLNNLRVLRYLVHDLKVSEDDKNRWYRHWVETGLEAVEQQLASHPATGRFCHGDAPTLADVVLVPQIHNAKRMDCRLDHVPTVMRVFEACMAHDAFAKTQPSACPDAA